jgi:hypothetical protein
MAQLDVQIHDNCVEIRSQAFWCEFSDTWANRKGLFVVLRALRSPETGHPLVSYQTLADGFGYADRGNIHNFLQEFQACEEDFEAYLRRKRKVDAPVVAAVTEEVRQAPLASEPVLWERVSGRLKRTDLRPMNIHAALEQVPCTVIRSPLRQQWETGRFHPKEAVLLQDALTILQQSSSDAGHEMVARLESVGITASTEAEAEGSQRQPVAVGADLLPPGLPVAQIPKRIQVMVLALTVYFWNVPLSRLGLGVGVSKSPGYQWVIGLAVAVYPVIQAWIVGHVHATCVAVDEKWLKLRQQWHYWFVTLDEATALPVQSHLLPTRTVWSCWWVLVSLKRLGKIPRAGIPDGLASYPASVSVVFPQAKHLLGLFHHQQGVTPWRREHATALPAETGIWLTRQMKRVLHPGDPRTVHRRLARLAAADTVQQWGLGDWISQTRHRLGHLVPALRRNGYPRPTNAIERFFRAFQRFYKTRGGVHSVRSAHRELMLFVVVSVFTKQASTGIAPIERIVPQASQMPLYHLLNDPFRYGLANICQAKRYTSENMATPHVPLELEMP